MIDYMNTGPEVRHQSNLNGLSIDNLKYRLHSYGIIIENLIW